MTEKLERALYFNAAATILAAEIRMGWKDEYKSNRIG